MIKKQPIALLGAALAIATPILGVTTAYSPVNAQPYSFDSINMQQNFSNINLQTNINNRQILDRVKKPSGSSNSRSGSSTKPTRSATGSSSTIFKSDPAISRQVQDDFLSKVSDPAAKKVLAGLLSPKSIKETFGPINTNDLVDIYSAASLFSYVIIEGKQGINKDQIRNTKQTFRTALSNVSMDNATMQRQGESLLYMTLLLVKSPNPAAAKPNAVKMVTAIGLNPNKFTLGDRGFVPK
jgi:hypothetical protein